MPPERVMFGIRAAGPLDMPSIRGGFVTIPGHRRYKIVTLPLQEEHHVQKPGSLLKVMA